MATRVNSKYYRQTTLSSLQILIDTMALHLKKLRTLLGEKKQMAALFLGLPI